MSTACRFPFRRGKPDATIYASPIVSTSRKRDDVMAVEDAVEVFVHVVEHVHHLHGRAVVAEGGEAHDIAEVNGDLVEQLRLHTTRLLQRAHHGPV
ncbi:hypothetical protein AMELA_G00174300, partial [Ameiurus melas]